MGGLGTRSVHLPERHGGGFTTAWELARELRAARNERGTLSLQRQLLWLKILTNDELGFMSLPTTGAGFQFGSGRLTRHVHNIEVNGESCPTTLKGP